MRTMDWKIGLAALLTAVALTSGRAAAQTNWTAQEPAGIPVNYDRTAALPGGKFTAAYHAGYYQWRADRYAWAQYKEMQAVAWQQRALEMQAAQVAQATAKPVAKTSAPTVKAVAAPKAAVSSQPATVYMIDAPATPVVAPNSPLPAPVVVKTQDMPGSERVLSSTVLSEKIYRVNPDGTQTLIGSQEFNGGSPVGAEPVPTTARKSTAMPKR